METEPFFDPYPRVPVELKELDQWVPWTYEDNAKVPLNIATGGHAGVNYPNTWAPYEDVVDYAAARNYGIGFVLTEHDFYTATDLDKCWSRNAPLDDRTRGILDLLRGYTELSPSLSGLHVFIRSELPVNRRTAGLEVYSSGRFITMTGRANPQAPQVIPDRTEELQELLHRYFPTQKPTVYPQTEAPVYDQEVWNTLSTWRNGAILDALRRGDRSAIYGGDESRGDLYLANALAWVVDDPNRIKSLMLQTGLVRPKWFEKRQGGTWLDLLVANALNYSRGKKR